MKDEQINELLYQALQTEMGGIEVYRTAVGCAVNEVLKEEWEEYLEQTEHHVQVLRS
jgi:bacterioferritin (cytochrome b1)